MFNALSGEGKLSGGAFFIALDINHWFGDPILILVDIPIGKPDESLERLAAQTKARTDPVRSDNRWQRQAELSPKKN